MPDITPLLAPALAGGGSSLQELLLSQLDTSDPTTALLVQMMANQSQEADKASDDDEDGESPRQRLKKLSVAFRQLRSKYERIQAEVKELQLRNDTCAAALGACYLCWGEFDECDICQGYGTVGHFPVEMQPFSEIVLPAVRAVKKQQHPPAINGNGLNN